MLHATIRAALIRGAIGWLVGVGAGTTPAWSADRALPVTAAPAIAGDLLMGFGPVRIQSAPSSFRFWEYAALGRANLALGPRWNLEAEANVKASLVSQTAGTGGFPYQVDGFLHLWASHRANSAWGVFGGVSPFLDVFSFFGGEFKHYLPHASFGAAAALTVASLGSGSETGWTFNGSANFYMNPNHRIGLSAAIMTGMPFSGGEPWQVSADFEHRSATLPVSLWLSATRMRTTNGNSWSALAGFRIFMDRPGSTLQSHEKNVPWTFITPQLRTTGVSG